MTNELAPVVMFAYNRPEHTRITLEHLSRNKLADETRLYILCDGAKAGASTEQLKRIEAVAEIAASQKWCGEVVVRQNESNKGLATNVFEGVSELIAEHGRIIVLEDDLKIGQGFLKFMNDGLNRYADDNRVMQVSGFRFPFSIKDESGSFFMPLTNTIGWGTWQRAWDKVDRNAKGYEVLKSDNSLMRQFNLDGSYDYSKILIGQLEQGSNDSWGILLWWSVFKNKGLILYPGYTFIQHNDFGNQGVHKSNFDHYDLIGWDESYREVEMTSNIEVDKVAFDAMKKYIRKHTKMSLGKVFRKVLALAGVGKSSS